MGSARAHLAASGRQGGEELPAPVLGELAEDGVALVADRLDDLGIGQNMRGARDVHFAVDSQEGVQPAGARQLLGNDHAVLTALVHDAPRHGGSVGGCGLAAYGRAGGRWWYCAVVVCVRAPVLAGVRAWHASVARGRGRLGARSQIADGMTQGLPSSRGCCEKCSLLGIPNPGSQTTLTNSHQHRSRLVKKE
eukprot:COSAG06_NODE_1217_length_10218_cov_129.446981_5_plen_193_part_00